MSKRSGDSSSGAPPTKIRGKGKRNGFQFLCGCINTKPAAYLTDSGTKVPGMPDSFVLGAPYYVHEVHPTFSVLEPLVLIACSEKGKKLMFCYNKVHYSDRLPVVHPAMHVSAKLIHEAMEKAKKDERICEIKDGVINAPATPFHGVKITPAMTFGVPKEAHVCPADDPLPLTAFKWTSTAPHPFDGVVQQLLECCYRRHDHQFFHNIRLCLSERWASGFGGYTSPGKELRSDFRYILITEHDPIVFDFYRGLMMVIRTYEHTPVWQRLTRKFPTAFLPKIIGHSDFPVKFADPAMPVEFPLDWPADAVKKSLETFAPVIIPVTKEAAEGFKDPLFKALFGTSGIVDGKQLVMESMQMIVNAHRYLSWYHSRHLLGPAPQMIRGFHAAPMTNLNEIINRGFLVTHGRALIGDAVYLATRLNESLRYCNVSSQTQVVSLDAASAAAPAPVTYQCLVVEGFAANLVFGTGGINFSGAPPHSKGEPQRYKIGDRHVVGANGSVDSPINPIYLAMLPGNLLASVLITFKAK